MLILASNSPRRHELLKAAGWSFKSFASNIDEQPLAGEAAQAYVTRLATEKAKSIQQYQSGNLGPDDVILAADTTVVIDGCILGKPVDVREAESMLRALQGRTHQVYTALAVSRPADHSVLIDLTITDVSMREYSQAEIDAYIRSGDPLDKAGAYAIQHRDFHPVKAVQGCYGNVVGLPVCKLARLLALIGCSPDHQPRLICEGSDAPVCAVAAYFNGNE